MGTVTGVLWEPVEWPPAEGRTGRNIVTRTILGPFLGRGTTSMGALHCIYDIFLFFLGTDKSRK